MPKAPGFIDKVNYIVDFWMNPCDAPLLVYLELAKAPAQDALITWFSFGLDDVVRGYLRPTKALGKSGFLGSSGRRGKGKKKGHRFGGGGIGNAARAVPGIGDDVGNWLGKRLPGAQELAGRAASQGEQFFWAIDMQIQRGLLALLVADIAVDFLYDWATALDETIFCQRDASSALYATGPGSRCGGIVICNAGNAPNIVFASGGGISWSTTVGSVSDGANYHIVSTMDLMCLGPGLTTHYQNIFVVRPGIPTYEARSKTQNVFPGFPFQSVLSHSFSGPASFVINHCASPGVVDGQFHDVSIWGGGSKSNP